MLVRFDDVDEFLADLSAELTNWSEQDGCAVDDGVVRICVSKTSPNQTSTEYELTAGFSTLGELRQLVLPCGVDFRNCGEEAAQAMNSASDKIREFCESKGLHVRGGKFQDD